MGLVSLDALVRSEHRWFLVLQETVSYIFESKACEHHRRVRHSAITGIARKTGLLMGIGLLLCLGITAPMLGQEGRTDAVVQTSTKRIFRIQ